jgi:hypothetical protein
MSAQKTEQYIWEVLPADAIDTIFSRCLDLNWRAMLFWSARHNHQIAAHYTIVVLSSLDDMPDRSNCVDDSASSRIGCECLQWL